MTPQWVGMVGTALVMLAFIPQIRILLRTRRAGALSFKSTLLSLTANGSLLAYALIRANETFVIVMGFQLVATLTILTLQVLYRRPAA